MTYRIGTDIGGTCTDSTVMDEDGRVYVGKDLTTYPDFSGGIFDSLRDATAEMDVDLPELLSETSLFLHATSVGENALFEREGAETALLTTTGFEETLHATRGGYGRWSGLPFEQVKDVINADKPEPLVPMERIAGVDERAYRDAVVEPIDDDDVLDAVDELVGGDDDDAAAVDALATSFLWSFAAPEHEQRVKELVAERYPDLYVSVSSDVSPTIGEYERTATTVLNAYLGPATKRYLDSLTETLADYGFEGSTLLMFSHGGLVSTGDAVERPVGLVESGPVGGLLGSRFVADRIGVENVVSTDMGGTTFKVGVVDGGDLEYADEPMVGRHHYQFPKRDVHSIAVAGGSVVGVDDTGVPFVGPESAGSDPGPVCYGAGGERPTVTDVDLIQGYFAPEYFLGGDVEMAPDAAREAFEAQVADPLGKSVTEAAADVYRLTNSMIADLVRETTVEKGIDPRRFTLAAIGGAAGMHAAAYARQLDVPQVLVPYTASVNSALGLLSTDVIHEYTTATRQEPPFDADEIDEAFADLEREAREKLTAEGSDPEEVTLERSIGMRYQRQVHELLTPVEAEGRLTDADLSATVDRFERRYEQRYGAGSAYEEGGIEIRECRIRAVGPLSTPTLHEYDEGGDPIDAAHLGTKEMHFDATGRTEADVYDFETLAPGASVAGPCVVLTPVTTIVVPPGDEARVDRYRNVVIDIATDDSAGGTVGGDPL